ncbi:hypothetical protein [Plantactinospora sp. KLBMP9567]|uniref:hypothetical protein n=1 Tax=Plantactinospora sp. KLBMP9567 TaxID=3085900 RepID=UPI0029814B80|nr:hypothetical protein [Plantactinospora sp. KLBMP9567]MDW5328043.1 hypothetical protein [Plantactinospora sp. KLBMP9567]
MINTSGTDERIGRRRAALSGVSGTARIGPLLELGRAYADRYGRATPVLPGPVGEVGPAARAGFRYRGW